MIIHYIYYLCSWVCLQQTFIQHIFIEFFCQILCYILWRNKVVRDTSPVRSLLYNTRDYMTNKTTTLKMINAIRKVQQKFKGGSDDEERKNNIYSFTQHIFQVLFQALGIDWLTRQTRTKPFFAFTNVNTLYLHENLVRQVLL